MSIQRYLLLLIISVVTIATFGAALHGYRASMNELEVILDQEMVLFASAIAAVDSHSQVIEQPEQANLVYQVYQQDTLLFRSSNSPKQPLSRLKEGFSLKNFLGTRWRVYSAEIGNRKIMVAQPYQQRIESAETVLLNAIGPIVVIIPLIGIMVVFAVRRSLYPLRELSRRLRRKSSDDLSEITVNKSSKELAPIITTINSVLTRLSAAFNREKRLASDAAHELRTPISVLNIAAHNLMSNYQNQALSLQDFTELSLSVERMGHVVEQILALNRTTPENFTQQLVSVDIESVLVKVIANQYEKIEQQQQLISLNVMPESHLNVQGDEFSLETLFENLVSNANKYAGSGCEIQLTAIRQSNGIKITVEDSGVGIPESELDKIFDRFYRSSVEKQNKAIVGCGLGMSIVEHIVTLHDGRIELGQSVLSGLKVVVILPFAEQALSIPNYEQSPAIKHREPT